MRVNVTTLFVVSVGPFFYWTLSGFKGTFDDWMSRYYDTDKKYYKNFLTGLALLAIILSTIITFIT